MIIDRLLQQPQLPQQPELHFHIVIPNEFSNIAKYNIGITAGIETTVAPPYWLDGVNRMDLNIVPSKFVKNVFETIEFDVQNKQTGQPAGKLKLQKPMEVLFEGADTNIYKKTKEFNVELNDQLKSIEEPFNFLYVGRLVKEKNIIKAAKVIDKINLKSKSQHKLLLIGEGYLLSKLKKYNCIKYLGLKTQSEIIKIVDNSHAFILPSIYEPWGVVVHEMTAIGMPVIVSNKSGSSYDLVIDGYNGFKFNPNNFKSIYN